MRFKNLEQYKTGGVGDRIDLGVPLPKTPNGRVYRFSPNEAAHPRHFVLGHTVRNVEPSAAMLARMKLTPRSSQTVCPYSGVVAEDRAFTHPDDLNAALETVKHAVVADIDAAIRRMFSDLNRSQPRNSMFGITMSVTSKPNVKPHFYRDDLLRELVCDHCGRDYGVYAIGLFCPDCGAPNLRLHFAREVDLVERQIQLAETQENERRELAYRLLGNAHEDVLTGFEATLKAVYLYGTARLSSTTPTVGNDFQNIERAQNRFFELSYDPFSSLAAGEMESLKLNIQKRHIIGHNLGIVDAKFAEHSEEDAKIGETVHLVGADIRTFAQLANKVVVALDEWLGSWQ
jgi:hypothetical protein